MDEIDGEPVLEFPSRADLEAWLDGADDAPDGPPQNQSTSANALPSGAAMTIVGTASAAIIRSRSSGE